MIFINVENCDIFVTSVIRKSNICQNIMADFKTSCLFLFFLDTTAKCCFVCWFTMWNSPKPWTGRGETN